MMQKIVKVTVNRNIQQSQEKGVIEAFAFWGEIVLENNSR